MSFPIGLSKNTTATAGVDYVYSANGYRGRFILGQHSVCKHEHKSPDAAVRCANKTAAAARRNGVIKL